MNCSFIIKPLALILMKDCFKFLHHQARMPTALMLDIQRSKGLWLAARKLLRATHQVRITLLSGDHVARFNIVNIAAESDIYNKWK